MPTLSLITAVLPSLAAHIGETDKSIAHAREHLRSSGWQIEWIVALDGPGEIPALPNADRIVTIARNCGVSATRNIALAEATGEWIAPLDADDTLESEGALAILLTIATDKTASWVGANRLHMDGSQTPHWRDEPACWNVGDLAPLWGVPFPFHPNSVVVKRECALAINGWPALPCNEDVGFVLSLSESYPGRFDKSVLNRYRLWESQTIAQPLYFEMKHSTFAAIEKSVNAKRAAAGRAPVSAPQPKMVYYQK